MIYRVMLKVGYHNARFDFEAVEDAATFARVALSHMVDCDDTNAKTSITMLIIDPTKESEEDD